MPMLYFASSEGRVGVYYTSLPNTGDPAYKPPPMPTPRKAAAAAPVNDTQAVVAGGMDFYGNLGSENRLFAWTAWSSRAAMPAPRQAHRAVRLPDGRIAFIGGQSSSLSGSQTNTVYIYDPNTNTWSSGPSIPERKSQMACALLENGRVWVAAGATPSKDRSATTHLFDPSTMTWSAAASLPQEIGQAAGGVLPGGKAGLPGGYGSGNAALNTFYIYDPSSNTWFAGPTMPTARSSHAVQWVERELIVIGGWPAGNAPTANEAYDPFANTWTQNPNAPVEVLHAASAKVGNMMFTFSDTNATDLVMAYWP